MRAALICRGCGEYAEIPGGCECPEVERMAEVEHLPASLSMTGGGLGAYGLRAEFHANRYDAIDAPWMLPMGGVVVHEADGVADHAVDREPDVEPVRLAGGAHPGARGGDRGGGTVSRGCLMDATMSYLDWSAIVARAQESHRLRRWAQFQADIGDPVSAARLIAKAERAEAIVLAIARRTGAAVDEPVTHMVDVPGSASQSCYWPQVKAHPRAVEFAR